MPPDTTIKVTKDLRARITAAAKSESATVNAFLEGLMAEYERSVRMAAAAAAMKSASPEVMEEYLKEFREWDVTLRDGLEGY